MNNVYAESIKPIINLYRIKIWGQKTFFKKSYFKKDFIKVNRKNMNKRKNYEIYKGFK